MEEQVEIPKSLEELKKELKSKNLVFGRDRTLTLLKTGKLAKVYLSSNVSKDFLDDCTYYAKLSNTAVVNLEIPNEELGTFCKRPHIISAIGLLK